MSRGVTILVAVAMVVALQAGWCDYITNPGFEESGGWNVGTGGGTWVTNLADSSHAHSGSQSYSVSWSAAPQWNAGVAEQSFDIAAGQNLSASAYILVDSINNADAYLETIFYDAGWVELANDTKLQSTHFSSPTVGWEELNLSGIVSNGAAHARLQLVVLATDNAASGSAFFDDVSVIPEPTTAALLGVAFAGLVVLRRRRTA